MSSEPDPGTGDASPSHRAVPGAGRLVLVGTPIGNLGDLPPRAAEAFAVASVVACEDTRRTGRLLHHLGVRAPKLVRLDDHTELDVAGHLLDRVRAGEVVAVHARHGATVHHEAVDLTVVDHPLALQALTALRDVDTDQRGFRHAMDDLATLLVYEATRSLAIDEIPVTTPMGPTTGVRIAEPPLVVPVLRDADKMSFAEIERNIEDLARRARDNKLKLEELEGGTFTITNGGIFGSLLSTPIVNPPQSGILGLHAIQERPVALGGNVVIRPTMYVALTYDHRIVDGELGSRVLADTAAILNDPGTALV